MCGKQMRVQIKIDPLIGHQHKKSFSFIHPVKRYDVTDAFKKSWGAFQQKANIEFLTLRCLTLVQNEVSKMKLQLLYIDITNTSR